VDRRLEYVYPPFHGRLSVDEVLDVGDQVDGRLVRLGGDGPPTLQLGHVGFLGVVRLDVGAPLGTALTPDEGLEAAELGLDLFPRSRPRAGLIATAGAGDRILEGGDPTGDVGPVDAGLDEDGFELVPRHRLLSL